MLKIKELPIPGYEKVIEAEDREANLHAFIAIHSTRLGPALGGIRFYPYPSEELALKDALRLAKAMTYKSALAKTGLGGGKSVIIGNSKTDKTKELFSAFAEALNALGGEYIAAEDIGVTTEDIACLKKETPFVSGLVSEKRSGDPSRFTAYGVYIGMKATLKFLNGSSRLKDKKVAIQGFGSVGSKLAHYLFWEGVSLIVYDPDSSKTSFAKQHYGAEIASSKEIMQTSCDIFAPCALGAILNAASIPLIKCLAVAGSANNQLAENDDGVKLMKKGILYAPDFVINAGGIINAAAEFDLNGYNPKIVRDKTDQIPETLSAIYERSRRENKPTTAIADAMAEYNLEYGIGKRQEPIVFS